MERERARYNVLLTFWPLTDSPNVLVGKKIIETYGQTAHVSKKEGMSHRSGDN